MRRVSCVQYRIFVLIIRSVNDKYKAEVEKNESNVKNVTVVRLAKCLYVAMCYMAKLYHFHK